MEPAAEAVPAGVPDLIYIRRRVARGRHLVMSLDKTMDMPAAVATARTLRTMLPPDMHVIASPPPAGRGPILTVLQLVTDSEAATLRPALEHLVAEFRQLARTLVDRLPAHRCLAPAGATRRLSSSTTRPGTRAHMANTAASKIPPAA